MSFPKIIKDYNKLLKEEQTCSPPLSNIDTYLIGGSKSRYTEACADIQHKRQIEISYKGGAKVANDNFKRHFLKSINQIVFLWFGTCEITFKTGISFIELDPDPHARVHEVIERYIRLKQEIIRRNPNSKVLFLECTYFSIIEWNRRKGSTDLD